MEQCPNCGQINRAGVVFCEFCGASLIGKKPLDTKSLDAKDDAVQKKYGVDAEAFTDVRVHGTSTFEEGDRLRLEIEGCPDPLLVEIKTETVFGRKDPATGAMPDIDLTPFAGYRMGVSRRHAAITRNVAYGLDVRDLGSSNGTFLNGQQLVAHRLYRLRNGDELRLGQMVIRILFERASVSAEATPAPKTASDIAEEKTPAQTLATQRSKQPDAAPTADDKKAPAATSAQTTDTEAESPSPSAAPSPEAPPNQAEKVKPEPPKPQAPQPATAQPKPEEPKEQAEKPPQDNSAPPDTSEAADKDKRD